MESRTSQLDSEKVAMLSDLIKNKSKEVSELRVKKESADHHLNRAEVELSNLRIEFTRALDGHLDMGTLKQKPPQRYEAQ